MYLQILNSPSKTSPFIHTLHVYHRNATCFFSTPTPITLVVFSRTTYTHNKIIPRSKCPYARATYTHAVAQSRFIRQYMHIYAENYTLHVRLSEYM